MQEEMGDVKTSQEIQGVFGEMEYVIVIVNVVVIFDVVSVVISSKSRAVEAAAEDTLTHWRYGSLLLRLSSVMRLRASGCYLRLQWLFCGDGVQCIIRYWLICTL